MSWRTQIPVVSLLLTFAFHASAAEWYREYAKAQDAVKNNDCQRGVPLLLQALQENPTTGLRVPTYGTMRMDYIPHLYLAECAYKSGNISQAANYLKEAEASGAASSSKASEFAQLKEQIQSQLQKSKKETPSESPPPATASNSPPASPPPHVAAPEHPTKPQQSVVPPKPTGATPEQQAAERRLLIGRTLKDANDAFLSGRYEAARAAANKVLLIDQSNDEAQRLLSQIVLKEAENTKKREKETKAGEINRALAKGDWATAESLAMNLKSQYPSDPAVASIVDEVEKQKDALLEKKTAEELSKALEKQVLIAYYKGDYETSIQLAHQALEKSSDNWRLHFFLGCSYAALSLLRDENKQPRLDLARASFRKARSLSGNLTPPPYISPKILEIYRSS